MFSLPALVLPVRLERMGAPTVGLAEAAKITGKSESTIRRKREELKELGATFTPKQGWKIPIPALVQLGLMEPVTPASEPPAERVGASTTAGTQSTMTPPDRELLDELERLRAELAEERQARAVAEAVNKERDRLLESYRETINVQAQALRMVEPPRPAEPQPAAAEPAPEPVPEEPAPRAPKKRWWQR